MRPPDEAKRRLVTQWLDTCCIALAGLLLSAFLASCSNTSAKPTIVNTVNKDPTWHKRFLKTRIGVLQREGNAAKVTGSLFDTIEP